MSTSPVSPAAAPAPAASTTTPFAGAMDKNMFLQLLVAQLKNQNPMRPTDSMQFVQQLAQFQQMETSVNMGEDVASIRGDLEKFLASQPAPPTNPASTTKP